MNLLSIICSIIILFSVSLFSQTRGIKKIVTKDEHKNSLTLYENSWALIIGINKYEDPKINQLNYAVNDASAISELLQSLDFPKENITLLTNEKATARNIRQEFQNLSEKIGKEERLLIYWAGHGQTDALKKGGERGYLIPYDGQKNNLLPTSIDMDELKRLAELIEAKHMLFLVDACYGGLTALQRKLTQDTKDIISELASSEAIHIITAGTKDEEVVESNEWGHSAFAKVILDGFRSRKVDINRNDVVTTNELFLYIKPEVYKLSSSVQGEKGHNPILANLSYDSKGEFIFILPEIRKEDMGSIQIATTPTDADVILDNANEGKSDLEILNIKPGIHSLEIRKAGYVTLKREISVDTGKVLDLKYTLIRPGSILVKSIPDSAEIQLNSSPKGVTPTVLADLEPGFYKIKLSKPDYLDVENTIQVTESKQIDISPSLTYKYGILKINSIPENADIYIDGKLTNKKTPATLPKQLIGEHTVELRKGNQKIIQNFSITSAQTTIIEDLRLELPRGNLIVNSEPPNADIFLDGDFQGKTNSEIPNVSAEQHVIQWKKPGYITETETIDVITSRTLSLQKKLFLPSSIFVRSVPESSFVTLNDKFVGKTPLNIAELKPATYKLKIIHSSDYYEVEENVEVAEGIKIDRRFPLVNKFGFVTAKDLQQGTRVYIDGKFFASNELTRAKLPTGSHRIEMQHDSFAQSYDKQIDVLSGIEMNVQSKLGTFSTNAFWRSALLPGWGQMYDGATLKGMAMTLGGIGTLAFSSLSMMNSKTIKNEYVKSLENYKNGTGSEVYEYKKLVKNNFEKLSNAERMTNISLVFLGCIYGYNLADVLMNHSRGVGVEIISQNSLPMKTEITSSFRNEMQLKLKLNF